MSNQRINILFPIGRLVQGSCYTPRTTDVDGNPLKFKRGPNEGQPRVQYFIAVAIPKTMQNWRDESSPDPKVGNWGALIYNFARGLHPQRDIDSKFAWKIVDGDSTIKNDKGKAPCECEGFPGHWVIKAASSYAPTLYDATGRHQLTEANLIKPGDYIRLYANVTSNGSNQAQTMGIHINPEMIAYCGVGERIHLGADAANVFGDCQQAGPAGMQPVQAPANPYEGVQQQYQPQQYQPQPQQYQAQPQQYQAQPQQYQPQPQQYQPQPQQYQPQPQQYQPQQYQAQPQQYQQPQYQAQPQYQPQPEQQPQPEVLTAPQPSENISAPSMTDQLLQNS